MSIIDLVQRECGTPFRRKSASEYCGPCPFCRAGEDRFQLWPEKGRYWCRVCGKHGDEIQFVRDFRHVGYAEALQYVGRSLGFVSGGKAKMGAGEAVERRRERPLQCHSSMSGVSPADRDGGVALGDQDGRWTTVRPPGSAWQDAGCDFAWECAYQLLGNPLGERARAWLLQRGLTEETLTRARIGFNPVDQWVERSAWGLARGAGEKAMEPGQEKKLWLPRGIVIPWWIDGDLWGLRIRRAQGQPKYYFVPGGSAGLYNAGALFPDCTTLLVEGEFDALILAQAAGDLAIAVATGGTQGARRARWLGRLAAARRVLVAFDMDTTGAGEQASHYWLATLPNALRRRPYWADVNDMAQAGVDVRAWVLAGLDKLHFSAPTYT